MPGNANAIEAAIGQFKSAAEFARAIGVSAPFVSQMRNGVKQIPAELCPRIERVTGGAVTMQMLRPDIFGPDPDREQ